MRWTEYFNIKALNSESYVKTSQLDNKEKMMNLCCLGCLTMIGHLWSCKWEDSIPCTSTVSFLLYSDRDNHEDTEVRQDSQKGKAGELKSMH